MMKRLNGVFNFKKITFNFINSYDKSIDLENDFLAWGVKGDLFKKLRNYDEAMKLFKII